MSAPVGISIREFARRDGCSDKLVRRALESGHLQSLSDGRIDPALVGSGWRKTNRRGADTPADTADCPHFVRTHVSAVSAPVPDAPHAPEIPPTAVDAVTSEQTELLLRSGLMSLVEAERAKENALALKHIIGARRAAGDVIEIAMAEAVLFEGARAARDAWLNWPARVGPLIAAELNAAADKVTEALTRHVHQQLVELGEPEADFRVDSTNAD